MAKSEPGRPNWIRQTRPCHHESARRHHWSRRPSPSALGRPGIRRFEWDLFAIGLFHVAGWRPPGAPSYWLGACAPGSLINGDTTSLGIWSIRPKGTSAKNWSVRCSATKRKNAAVINIEWIAFGFTAVSFWTVPRRLIVELESLARSKGFANGPALPGSIESE
jgi:hypothetical protein